MGDNGPDEIPQDTAASVPELPAYPFAAANQNSSKKNKTQSSRQAIARILGFNKPANNGTAVQAPQSLPQLSSAPMPLPILGQSLPKVDVRSAQAMINHPQVAEGRIAASIPNASSKPARLEQLSSASSKDSLKRSAQADNAVVVASAGKNPVEHSFSDRASDSESLDSAEVVTDLVNSLVPAEPAYEEPAEVAPKFSDSINIQVAEKSEDTSVNMSLSDRDAAPASETTLASAAIEQDNVPQFMSLSDRDSEPAAIAVAVTPKPTPLSSTYDNAVKQPVEAVSKTSVNNFENTVQHAVSSRRDMSSVASPRNEVRAPELQSFTKQPLVPMLASASGRTRVNAEPRALQPVPSTSAVTTAEMTTPAPVHMPVQQPTLTGPSQSNLSQPSATQQVQGKEIRVMCKDSVSLQSSETIQGVSVEHEDICQIIQNGPKSYSVIGLRDGETRIAIVSETAGQRNVQVQKVLVSSSKNSTSKDIGTLAAEISQSVAQLYPRQRVRITPRGTQLVISGTVDSEDTAKKIVSLVRKTTLTPVVDELKTK